MSGKQKRRRLDLRAASREELLTHLEQLTRQRFRTREDVANFVSSKAAKELAKKIRAERNWSLVKQAALAVLFAIAVLQYYSFDVVLQILSLREGVTVFVPVSGADVRSALTLVALS